MALSAHTFESGLVWQCLEMLEVLGTNNRVTLMWVPGHSGIDGNERADSLAKEGGSKCFIGPEPFCGYPKSHLRMELQKWEDCEKASRWVSTPGLRQSKKFISYSKSRTKKLLSLSKHELRILTGIFTGHCPLGYHLKKIGKAENDTCRFCKEAPETAEHVICKCEAVSRKRLLHLEQRFLEPHEVWKAAATKVLKFTKELLPEWA